MFFLNKSQNNTTTSVTNVLNHQVIFFYRKYFTVFTLNTLHVILEEIRVDKNVFLKSRLSKLIL